MEASEPASVILIAGATASGKTELAVHLAGRLGGEIVGGDSVQVYRRLDIGSAKPRPDELRGVRHHVLDMADIDEAYDAARFVADADRAIADIRARGRVPIVAGGAGLYLRALVRGLAQGIASDPDVRARLNAEAASSPEALAAMHRRLTALDPTYAAKIHANDPIRIVRAFEVMETTGEPISAHHARHAAQRDRYEVLWVALDVERDVLRARIAARARAMFAAGWLDEVRGVLADGYAPDLKPLRSVGYAQVVDFVTRGGGGGGGGGEEDAIERVRAATVAFAKRQRTWFRGEPGVIWERPDALRGDAWVERMRAHVEGK
ncbi:MAG: tRNA (adenosine(37)-N6)-dimethylallyltransferase MiaA [Deltaproteobacteria bacterium]